jgi:hypothetical protein
VLAVDEDPDEAPVADDEEVAAELLALDEEHEDDEDDEPSAPAAEAGAGDEEETVWERPDETDEDVDAALMSTRRAPARRSRRWASSRPRAPAAC